MSAALARAAVVRTLLLTVVWWALVEGDTSVLSYGWVLVPLAVATSLALLPVRRPSRAATWRRVPAGLALVGWFLWQSARGGVDVARRALARPVDLAQETVTYPWRVTDPGARVLVAGINGLMPGTLSVDVGEEALHLHVLHRDLAWEPQLAELERRVAATLGVDLG